MDVLKVLTMLVQLGTSPSFPDGDATLQQALADKITVICKDSITGNTANMHELKNNPKFEKTSPSLFTKENIKNNYIFLTYVDSNFLYIEDCDYSMLKFLRYKTNQQRLQYLVSDSADNNEKLRAIWWGKKIPFKMYDDNFVYESNISVYTEYWACSYKSANGNKYPFIMPQTTALRKNYTEEQLGDLKYLLSNPIMVLSIIPFDDNAYDLPYNLEGKTTEAKLETTKGKKIEGSGIDLNGDKILDAFWYNDIKDSKIVEVYVRLYINLEGNWVPIWYTYFKEQ
jgi:hypothetical protein